MGNGLSNGWVQTVGADIAPRDTRAEFLGIWNFLHGSGLMVGPLLVGSVSQVVWPTPTPREQALIGARWARDEPGMSPG